MAKKMVATKKKVVVKKSTPKVDMSAMSMMGEPMGMFEKPAPKAKAKPKVKAKTKKKC